MYSALIHRQGSYNSRKCSYNVHNIFYVLSDKGEVYVWGFGILGKGPNLQESETPQLLPKTLFGQGTFSKDVRVEKLYSGVSCFAAVTSKRNQYLVGMDLGGLIISSQAGVGSIFSMFTAPWVSHDIFSTDMYINK